MHHSQAYTRVFPRCHLFCAVAFGARYRNLFFCFGSRQCFICPCFLAFQHRYPSKNDFLSQIMSPSDKPKKQKTKMKRRRSFTCLSTLKFCSQGTELNCSARPHCPPWVMGCGFPHPKKRKMKKEEGTPKRKGWKTVAFATPLFYHICLFLSVTTFCGDGLYQI